MHPLGDGRATAVFVPSFEVDLFAELRHMVPSGWFCVFIALPTVEQAAVRVDP